MPNASHAFAELQRSIKENPELRDSLNFTVVIAGISYGVDLGQLVLETEPVNGARVVTDLTAKLAAMVAR